MKRILFSTGLILIGVMAVAGYFAYGLLWKSNVSTPNGKPVEIYVGSNWTYDSLRQALDPYLITGPGFDQLADQMNLRNKVIPGKYIIQNGWTNRRLIRHFRWCIASPWRLYYCLPGAVCAACDYAFPCAITVLWCYWVSFCSG